MTKGRSYSTHIMNPFFVKDFQPGKENRNPNKQMQPEERAKHTPLNVF